MKLSRCVALALSFLVFTAPAAFAQWIFFGWTISEFQPDIANGGRANTIAVHPATPTTILVASESGGLFKSTNSGTTWRHVDGLPAYATMAVAYVPADPSIVIATTGEDFRAPNGGGIWRSTDGGTTWTQMPGPPRPGGVTARLSAYEISIAPDNGIIYVATEYGLSKSTDNGATWTHLSPFSSGDRRVHSVAAQRSNRVLAAGPAGIRHSSNAGGSWLPPAGGTAGTGVVDIHALGRAPFSFNQAYVVNADTELRYTEDGGDHWTRIASFPGGGGGCGGITFVKAIGLEILRLPTPFRTVTLYAGNRCGVSKLSCGQIAGTDRFDYSGTWVNLVTDHGDTRDLGFDGRVPLLLATDGGLHKTADSGLHWTFAGGGHNGYNALQITEVKGQWITSTSGNHLYFGTQDNDLWASGDGGTTWASHWCCEGFFIERQHRVAAPADSKTTFVSCGDCFDYIADPVFTSIGGWPDATTPPNGNPTIVRRNWHVQGVDTVGAFTKGLATTSNLGAAWSQYATFPEDRRDLPKLSDPGLLPVLYQAIRTGYDFGRDFEINQLARVTKRFRAAGASVTYPAMNNFGGLGINPTMFAWYQVYGVDPGNSRHLIAPDVINEKMMETWDGGDNWTEIPGLTSQITDSGNFLFRRWIFPHASVVSFFKDDPRLVAVGTWQGGLFVSGDRGATWSKVPGSERATYITSVEWRSATQAVVSTYGRGLWKLQWRLIRPWPDFEVVCREPCILRLFEPPGDPAEKYNRAVLVFDGSIQGAIAPNGVLRELFVTPGSSVVFFGDGKEGSDFKITETSKSTGFEGVKLPVQDNQLVVGMTLNEKGRVGSGALAEKPLAMYTPDEKEVNQDKEDIGRKESPTAGKPYLQLTFGRGSATNSVEPGQQIRITARNFPPMADLEVIIDNATVAKTRTGDNGVFTATVTAPKEVGLHSLKVRDAASKKFIDGVMFLVRHKDTRKNG